MKEAKAIFQPFVLDRVLEWPTWLYRSLVSLVIACPCALVISTLVSIVAVLAASARNGVLVKGGIHIDVPAQLNYELKGEMTSGEKLGN